MPNNGMARQPNNSFFNYMCRAVSAEHVHTAASRSIDKSAHAEEAEDEDDQSLFDAEIRNIIGRGDGGDGAGAEASP